MFCGIGILFQVANPLLQKMLRLWKRQTRIGYGRVLCWLSLLWNKNHNRFLECEVEIYSAKRNTFLPIEKEQLLNVCSLFWWKTTRMRHVSYRRPRAFVWSPCILRSIPHRILFVRNSIIKKSPVRGRRNNTGAGPEKSSSGSCLAIFSILLNEFQKIKKENISQALMANLWWLFKHG